jgi:hypothetical protein
LVGGSIPSRSAFGSVEHWQARLTVNQVLIGIGGSTPSATTQVGYWNWLIEMAPKKLGAFFVFKENCANLDAWKIT